MDSILPKSSVRQKGRVFIWIDDAENVKDPKINSEINDKLQNLVAPSNGLLSQQFQKGSFMQFYRRATFDSLILWFF